MFVFRNYTIENLFPDATVFSGYGDISFIPQGKTDLVWFYQVPINFDKKHQTEEVTNIQQKLELVSSMLGESTLYIVSLENLFPIRSIDCDYSLSNAIDEFNKRAKELAESNSNIRFIDLNEFLARFPEEKWINWRFYFISQMIFAPEIAAEFFPWFSERIEQINGKRKKCLVLDLDNTLWGGVLGEDGVEGIKIGGEYPGNAFLYFQEGLVELAKNGVILTVCSKNNEVDVLEVWAKNPFIKLKQEYISSYRINWQNKADNIRELAKELNIGLDSFVFVDDNPTERELVKHELPMVSVPEFPTKPYGLMRLYQQLVSEYFRAYELTNEDKAKTAQYKANAQRAASCQQFSDMESFIRSLGIEIEISSVDNFNISRIAQMTQKTNQFNLTTHRYTEADIQNFIKDGAKVYCLSVKDKFGDNGITGAIIIGIENGVASIDTLLLSCRILGKDIEFAFVNSILNILQEKGIKQVIAQYIPTAKNGIVSDFYDKMDFSLVSEIDGVKKYSIQLINKFSISDKYTITIK